MNATDAKTKVLEIIARERTAIVSRFDERRRPNFDRRFAVLELTRAMNFAFLRRSGSDRSDDIHTANLMIRGFNPAISLFMNDDVARPGVPNIPSHPLSQAWADQVLCQIGDLETARRIVEMESNGLIQFVSGTPQKLCFEILPGMGLAEQRDLTACRWLSDSALEQDDAEYRDLERNWNSIESLLSANVRVFAEHYVEYGAAPEIDQFFDRHAILHIRRSFGNDAFPVDAVFGGLPYGAYEAAAVALVGWALKHTAFAMRLLANNQSMDIRNLLSPWGPLSRKITSLAAQLDVTEKEATQLLDPFIAGAEIFDRLGPVYDAPIPIFLPVAHDLHLFSVAAAQLTPYGLLLRRLRESYPGDYFGNVNKREGEFREQLRWMLPVRRVHFASQSINLRDSGRVITDIDAVALVKETGTLGLFQLKWQDPFGAELSARRSRMTNLIPSANKWIAAVIEWLGKYGPNAIVKQAGFQHDVPIVRKVVLFVIGRYHCGFSGSELQDPRAAWSTWPEVIKFIDDDGIVVDPVDNLFNQIMRHQAEVVHTSDDVVVDLELPDLKIEIRRSAK